jgi:hypothetical protein
MRPSLRGTRRWGQASRKARAAPEGSRHTSSGSPSSVTGYKSLGPTSREKTAGNQWSRQEKGASSPVASAAGASTAAAARAPAGRRAGGAGRAAARCGREAPRKARLQASQGMWGLRSSACGWGARAGGAISSPPHLHGGMALVRTPTAGAGAAGLSPQRPCIALCREAMCGTIYVRWIERGSHTAHSVGWCARGWRQKRESGAAGRSLIFTSLEDRKQAALSPASTPSSRTRLNQALLPGGGLPAATANNIARRDVVQLEEIRGVEAAPDADQQL